MVPTHAPKPLVWLLTMAVACFFSIACATEKDSEQKDSETARKSAEPAEQEAAVYTNEDLDKLFGEEGSTEQTALTPEEESGEEREPVMEMKVVEPQPAEKVVSDPLNLMQQQQALSEERTRIVAEAELAVANARARVKQLEQRVLALKNPYMARPEIPEEERADWDSLGTRERREKTEEKLIQAREELKAAEAELAKVR